MSGETPTAVFFDLDGTLYDERGVIPGAPGAVAFLRDRGVPIRFVTNTTRRSPDELRARLVEYGFHVEPSEVFTPFAVLAEVLRDRGVRTVAPFVEPTAIDRLDLVRLAGGTSGRPRRSVPDAVLIGDLGDGWSHALLNEAFGYVLDGAALIALQKGRYWRTEGGLQLDAGAYVAGLEFATGVDAIVCGKPSPEFFRAVARSAGIASGETGSGGAVMVGDDLWNDIEGAQRVGMRGWLVRTGKFREDVLAASSVIPDRVVTSVAHAFGTA